jgi:hypothetical protein
MSFLNQKPLNTLFSVLGLAILAVSTISPVTTNAKEIVSNAGGGNVTINPYSQQLTA